MSITLIGWFYLIVERYGGGRDQSAIEWLRSAWNSENDFEHGPLFPLVVLGMICFRFREMRATAGRGNSIGLWVVFAGILFYVAAYRTLQPRVAIGALPFLLWGGVLHLWGWRVARLAAFPLFFFWLAIPVPQVQQATVGLQILSAKMAHHGADLLGVETVLDGTRIASAGGKWEALEIAKGCSGIRSLMALLMISGAWAYVARIALWKKAVLFLAAFPLAVIGNVLRVVSIFVIAEHGDSHWARTTWHDWSGLLLFYPFSLFLLLCTHSLLEGGLPWRKPTVKVVRRTVIADADGEPVETRSS
ncbi:MAG: exosortase/archaeosortase family protein [Verrucomicrobiota bacterium]